MGRYREPYTLYKRGKYWYYKTYDKNGRHTAGTTTGKKTKYEARQFCEALYLGDNLTKNNTLFNTFAADFYAPNGLYFRDRGAAASVNTIQSYNSLLKNHILPYFEGVKIADIDYIKLKEFRVFIFSKNSAATTTLIMGTLKRVLEAAYKNDIIKNNPYDKLETFTAPLGERDAFTLDEVKLLIELIPPLYKNLLLSMALCGLRVSEALGVTKDDIKEAGGVKYIDLRRQLCKGQYIPLKRNSARVIPVIDEVAAFFDYDLKGVYTMAYTEFKKIKGRFNDYEARGLSFHSLRHFFITNTKSSGIIESKIEVLAGHKLKGIASVYTNYKLPDLLEVLAWQEKTLKYILGQ